ncbi:MAG: response regulator transcription factor [Solirubrobacterales bacterium]|nr:response regulator transcription factor [Solirubrobacterales bacterium]
MDHLHEPGRAAPIRLLIVDDHEVVREGLVAALAADGRFEVIAAAGSAEEGLAALRRARPDVAVVDLRLPDMPGDVLCRTLRERLPATPVVVLSSFASEDTLRAAMDAGASAYISKAAGLGELRDTLRRVAAEGPDADAPQIREALHRMLVRRDDDDRPTPRQERVLELAADGLTYQEIGDRLFISESTVRFHMQKLKAKFGARTKTDLIAKAIRAGVITPPAEERRPCP